MWERTRQRQATSLKKKVPLSIQIDSFEWERNLPGVCSWTVLVFHRFVDGVVSSFCAGSVVGICRGPPRLVLFVCALLITGPAVFEVRFAIDGITFGWAVFADFFVLLVTGGATVAGRCCLVLGGGTTGRTGVASSEGTEGVDGLCLLCFREIVIQLTSSSGESSGSHGRSALPRWIGVPWEEEEEEDGGGGGTGVEETVGLEGINDSSTALDVSFFCCCSCCSCFNFAFSFRLERGCWAWLTGVGEGFGEGAGLGDVRSDELKHTLSSKSLRLARAELTRWLEMYSTFPHWSDWSLSSVERSLSLVSPFSFCSSLMSIRDLPFLVYSPSSLGRLLL